MLYKVRFSEGSDIEWQEICEKALEEGYEIEIAVPDVIIVDTEEMTITQDRDGSFAPTVPIEEIQEYLGLVEDLVSPVDGEDFMSAEQEELESVPETRRTVTEDELEGDTVIIGKAVSVATNLEGPILVEQTDYMLKITIG